MNTRDKIVLAAVKLFVKQGIAGTTTKEIASAAAVAEGSIYRYFASKDELAWQIFDQYCTWIAVQLEACIQNEDKITAKVRSMVHCFLNMADEDWLMFSYYLTSYHKHYKKINNKAKTPFIVILDMIGDLQKNEKEAVILSSMIIGALHQVALSKLFGMVDGSLQIFNYQITSIINSMIACAKK